MGKGRHYFKKPGKGDKGAKHWGKRTKEDENSHAVHAGSVPIEELKVSKEWEQRIVHDNSVASKRKYAICVGYVGTEFVGSQINPGFRTVEQVSLVYTPPLPHV